MSPKKAILLTIIGIFAAWLIIRGIQSWEGRHAVESQAAAPVAVQLNTDSRGAGPSGIVFI